MLLALWKVCSIVNEVRAPRLAVRDQPSPSKPVIPCNYYYSTHERKSQVVLAVLAASASVRHDAAGRLVDLAHTGPRWVLAVYTDSADGLQVVQSVEGEEIALFWRSAEHQRLCPGPQWPDQRHRPRGPWFRRSRHVQQGSGLSKWLLRRSVTFQEPLQYAVSVKTEVLCHILEDGAERTNSQG